MKFTSLIIAFFVTITSVKAHAADVMYTGTKEGFSFVFFSGPIQAGDLQKLVKELDKVQPGKNKYNPELDAEVHAFLMISSKGGSVDEAMRIGDYVEKHEIGVMIPQGIGECLSSCVLILAGGDTKTVNGRIGIHRPYLTDLSIGGDAGAESIRGYIEKIRNYLDGKGIAPSLIDDMFSVPPEEMKYLSKEEVSRYRLNQTNYLKQERADIEMAKDLGLTRQQYMQKKMRMDKECSGFSSYDQKMKCIHEIMGTK